LDMGSSAQVKIGGRIYEIHHKLFLVDHGEAEVG